MVNFALTFVALALAASVAAAPAPAETAATVVAAGTSGTSGTTFSFAGWVEELIDNPDHALSVDEAIEAAHAAEVVGSAGGLQKRTAKCDPDQVWKRASVRSLRSPP
jgi:TRAP-type uncharacterized transport system substrate-binding protein